jgi:hypothetical protein
MDPINLWLVAAIGRRSAFFAPWADPPKSANGVMRYAAERTGEDPKFTKHAATW